MAARDWSANTLLMMEISGADSEKYRLVITSQPTVLIVRSTPNKTSPIVNLVRSNSLNEGRLYVAASGGNMMRQETKRLATITVLLGFFVIMLDTTIVNVSLAHIGKDLHGTTASLQWVVDAYTLSFAALLLSAGTACDRLGSQRIYLFGLILFALFSIACALSPSMGILISARALQGVGAAMVVPSSLALISEMYSDHKERAKIIGLWGAAGGIAAALGPIIGGALVSTTGWRAAFWVNIPIIGVLAILTISFIPRRVPQASNSFDVLGQITSIISLSLLTYLVITWGERGWNTAQLPALLVGLLCMGLFLIIEWKNPTPMLPLTLFKTQAFSISSIVGFCLNFSFFGQLFVLSLYFQKYLGWSPWIAGLAMVPQATSAIVASPLGGRFSAKFDPYSAMFVGLSVGALGFSSLVFINENTPYVLVALLTFCAGFGMAFAMPAATSAAINAVPYEFAGVAGGIINAARQTGSVFGVAILGIMIANGNFLAGFHHAVLVAGGVFALAAVLVMLASRHPS